MEYLRELLAEHKRNLPAVLSGWLQRCSEQLKLSLGAAVTTILVAAIYLLLVWSFIGAKEGRQEFELRLALSAAPLLGFPLLYLVNFFLSPRRIYDEAQSQIRELSERLDRKPRLSLSYAAEKTQKFSNGSKQTFLYAINEGGGDVEGAQVKIEEAQFRRVGSDAWEGTSIVARTNMSWGFLPDGDPQKYSTVPLAHGKEPIDFISGPLNVSQSDGQPRLGFIIRIDPRHWKSVSPVFWENGTYKFVMQVSAIHIEKPGKLTLFVDWDGKNLVICSDDNPGQVLESCRALAV
jgi:hypothetical protein